MSFAQIVVDTYQDPKKKFFTYSIPGNMNDIEVGAQVKVPFGKRTVSGYVWEKTKKKPNFPTKEIEEVEKKAFTPNQMKLAKWLVEKYLATPLESLKCQMGKTGEKEKIASEKSIDTLILVPYASQVKIRALEAKEKGKKALVGSRSAVFTKLPNLKRIVVEGAENWNYKDERAPYYHATNVAKKRGEIEDLKVTLNYQMPRIDDIVKEDVEPTKIKRVKIIDLKKEREGGNFSPILMQLEETIRSGVKTIIYTSSKEVQEEAKEYLSKGGLDRGSFELFGPELFAIPGKEAETVFWLDADTILNLPDFRAHEKAVWTTAKLGQRAKTVYMQTANKETPIIQDLKEGNSENFVSREIKARKSLNFPPFSTLVKLTFTSTSKSKTRLEAEKLYEKITTSVKTLSVEVSPPYPPYIHTPRKIQLNIALKIKSKEKEALAKLAKVIPPDWRVEVDPESLI